MAPLTQFTHDGLTFDVVDSGPADGTTVVLLHGFPQRANAWDRVAPLLHDQGYRTIAPDQRGYSPGARPVGRRAYALSHLAGDIAALIDEIGEPVHLVGHDWGAIVAWAVAADYPAKVQSLTAVSVGHPAAFLRAIGRSNQLLRSWYMLFFQIPWLPERLLTMRSSAGDKVQAKIGMSPQMVERFRSEIVDDGALHGGVNWYRGLPFGAGSPNRPVSAPTTMVWSDGDHFLGESQAVESQRYVDGDFEFRRLDGASHWIPEERPTELAEAILARIATVP